MASDPRPCTLSLEGFFLLLDLPTAPLLHRSSVSPCRAEIPTLFGPKVSSLSGFLPLNPLDATLTKNAAWGALYLNQRTAVPSLHAILSSPEESLVGSRQKYPADPQRPVSCRESPRRQSCFSRFDPGVPRRRLQNPCPHRGDEQLRPADCFFSDRFAHPGLLRNLPSGCASRRRPHCHFQWLGHAQEQGRP